MEELIRIVFLSIAAFFLFLNIVSVCIDKILFKRQDAEWNDIKRKTCTHDKFDKI
jgi:hypothetical protein